MAPGDPIAAKRKRGVVDLGPSRPSPALRGASAVSSAASLAASAAAAAQEAAVPMDSYDEATIGQLLANSNGELQNGGQSATETAQAALTHYQVPPSFEALPTGGTDPNNPFSMDLIDQLKDAGAASHTPQHANSQSSQNPKPVVGSEEWHRIRRDNHKEVERRRRETINEGITELSRIVPGCEKNKGSILQRAVAYIAQLKENEQKNIEKWTLEKLLLDQAITELSASGDRLKADLTLATKERDFYKKHCDENGIQVDLKELDYAKAGDSEE